MLYWVSGRVPYPHQPICYKRRRRDVGGGKASWFVRTQVDAVKRSETSSDNFSVATAAQALLNAYLQVN